jgi:hypothetical protein
MIIINISIVLKFKIQHRPDMVVHTVIPATQKTEIRRIAVRGLAWTKSMRPYLKNN